MTIDSQQTNLKSRNVKFSYLGAEALTTMSGWWVEAFCSTSLIAVPRARPVRLFNNRFAQFLATHLGSLLHAQGRSHARCSED